jgi:mannitol-1-phosphate/altronate dehydrogenase
VLKRFAALYAEAGNSANPGAAAGVVPAADAAAKMVHAVLTSADWWGEDLTAYPGLEAAVSGHLAAIWKSGVKAVIEQIAGVRA